MSVCQLPNFPLSLSDEMRNLFRNTFLWQRTCSFVKTENHYQQFVRVQTTSVSSDFSLSLRELHAWDIIWNSSIPLTWIRTAVILGCWICSNLCWYANAHESFPISFVHLFVQDLFTCWVQCRSMLTRISTQVESNIGAGWQKSRFNLTLKRRTLSTAHGDDHAAHFCGWVHYDLWMCLRSRCPALSEKRFGCRIFENSCCHGE